MNNSKSIISRLVDEMNTCEHDIGAPVAIGPVALHEFWEDIDPGKGKAWIEGVWVKRCRKCSKIIEFDPSLRELKEKILGLKEDADRNGYALVFNKEEPVPTIAKPFTSEPVLAETAAFEAVVPKFHLDHDVILPQTTRLDIENALIKLDFWKTIYEEWGFAKVDPLGKGAIFNFYGPPGTGKTRTAEALAGRLGISFINVHYGELQSRFMGQTSKNIRLAFQTAKEQQALLFFDEADNVLSRRATSITSGVDAESNVSKSTLLKELEQFDGVCVFATNFSQVYDHAVVRRMGFDIKFELPDLATRKMIWEMHLVPGVPLAEERTDILDGIASASEGCAGGDILKAMRIALPMAIPVGGQGAGLTLQHLQTALRKVVEAKEENEKSMLSARQQLGKEIYGLR